MVFAACTAGANTEPAASAAPVAADAFMKARRLTRTMSPVFAMPSSLSDRTAPLLRAVPVVVSPGSEPSLAPLNNARYVRLSNEGSHCESLLPTAEFLSIAGKPTGRAMTHAHDAGRDDK